MDPLIDRRLADLARISNFRKEKGFAAALAAQQAKSADAWPRSVSLLGVMENEERDSSE